MKKILSLALIGLLVLCGSDALAQTKKKKSSKKQASPFVEGRQKVRESDFATFDRFSNFNSKDNNIYYCTFDYTDFPALTVDDRPEWPDDIKPVMNYLEKVSRASLTICALYAINPEITDYTRRQELTEQARREAEASLDEFANWRLRKNMRNKVQHKIAEIDYRYFKGNNYYNEKRDDDIIHVGVLLYLGNKKNTIFHSDTTSHTFADIRFFPNDATIVESWMPVIDELANTLKANDRLGVLLTGYSDNQGTDAYSEGISRQRATEVKKALLMRGIEANRIEVIAKGAEDPIGDNTTYEGRVLNNRVSIKVQ